MNRGTVREATARALRDAIALHESGRPAQAEALLHRALEQDPGSAEAHCCLGNVLASLGRREEAASSYREALARDPALVEAHVNLASALIALGRPDEAERHAREAVALRPDLAVAHNNHGIALALLERHEEAERSYRQALALEPGYAEAHNNLGNLLVFFARAEEAERSFREAIALRPELAEAHYHLGLALASLGRLGDAEQHYREALALRPAYAEAHHDLGNALRLCRRIEEAERCYREALAHRPDFPEALCQWVHARQWLCDWAGLEQPIAAMHRHVAEGGPGQLTPFCFLALPDARPEEQLACARLFAERAFRKLLSQPPLHGGESRPPRERLRIGYLSADFHEHATSYLLAEVIERHDRRRFEVFGYSCGPEDASPMRARMRAAFDVFRDIRADSSETAGRQIAADGVDILVDLKGYTADNRLEIMALRPAPVQASWLGYPGALGHPRLADYVIGDPVATPLEHAAHFSESLALMPHCYQPNDRKRPIGDRPSRAQAGLPEEGFVFCSFCQPYKITPAMFDLWCRLLREVPGSVLWLQQTAPSAQANLRREAAARGVAPERLVFAPPLPLAQHLGRLQIADLALDTCPYTSHTTASDALWAGVPLVTMLGDSFVSRVAASILRAADLPELVAEGAETYYRLALEVATRPDRMAAIRAKLAANRASCPLFDSERFARDLEQLYERMWSSLRAGKRGYGVPGFDSSGEMSADVKDFSIDRFERLAHDRRHGEAIGEMLKLLRHLDHHGGGFHDIGQMPSGTYLSDEYDAHMAGRIASALTTLFSDPLFHLAEPDFLKLVPYQRWLAAIFGASHFGSADHVIRLLDRRGHDNRAHIVLEGSINLKSCLLQFPDSTIPLQPEVLWQKNKRIAVSLFLAILASRIVASPQACAVREQLLAWLPARLGELAFDDLPIQILHDVWMHCSYAESPGKHAIKSAINEIMRAKLLSAGFSDVAVTPPPERSKPVAICILEKFYLNHPMYRTHSRSLEAMKAKYRLVGVFLQGQSSEETRRLFDEAVVLPGTYGILDTVLAVMRLAGAMQPDLVYYPCVGMLAETIFLINLRFAPIQVVASGHPATTHSRFVDYMLVEEDYLGDPGRFSEVVVPLPKDSNPYRPRLDTPAIAAEADASAVPVKIAIAASVMKINSRFLQVLQTIRDASCVPLEYHFLPAGAVGFSKCHVQKLIRSVLPDCAVIYPHQEYARYLEIMNGCQIFLNPFPYGNTNGIVDTVYLGLPGVCLTGPEVHSHIDEGMFRRVGLPQRLIARSVEEYVSAARELVENAAYRTELRKALRGNNAHAALFRGKPELFLDVIETLRENHGRP